MPSIDACRRHGGVGVAPLCTTCAPSDASDPAASRQNRARAARYPAPPRSGAQRPAQSACAAPGARSCPLLSCSARRASPSATANMETCGPGEIIAPLPHTNFNGFTQYDGQTSMFEGAAALPVRFAPPLPDARIDASPPCSPVHGRAVQRARLHIRGSLKSMLRPSPAGFACAPATSARRVRAPVPLEVSRRSRLPRSNTPAGRSSSASASSSASSRPSCARALLRRLHARALARSSGCGARCVTAQLRDPLVTRRYLCCAASGSTTTLAAPSCRRKSSTRPGARSRRGSPRP